MIRVVAIRSILAFAMAWLTLPAIALADDCSDWTIGEVGTCPNYVILKGLGLIAGAIAVAAGAIANAANAAAEPASAPPPPPPPKPSRYHWGPEDYNPLVPGLAPDYREPPEPPEPPEPDPHEGLTPNPLIPGTKDNYPF
jgi:hypothetical protein